MTVSLYIEVDQLEEDADKELVAEKVKAVLLEQLPYLSFDVEVIYD